MGPSQPSAIDPAWNRDFPWYGRLFLVINSYGNRHYRAINDILPIISTRNGICEEACISHVHDAWNYPPWGADRHGKLYMFVLLYLMSILIKLHCTRMQR